MSITYIGSTLSISAATPASETGSAYGALTFTEVGRVVSIGELGDKSQDVSFDLLKTGRTIHVNGVMDLGEIPVTIEYLRADAGLTILEAGANSNTTHSFVVTDADGDDYYFQGLIANLVTSERTAGAYKGMNFVIRGQSGLTKVDGV